jgi:flagellar protein FlbD
MIQVTRLNDTKLVINADLIEFVEEIPDTIISLTTGKKIMVKEDVKEIIEKVAQFRRMSTWHPAEAEQNL